MGDKMNPTENKINDELACDLAHPGVCYLVRMLDYEIMKKGKYSECRNDEMYKEPAFRVMEERDYLYGRIHSLSSAAREIREIISKCVERIEISTSQQMDPMTRMFLKDTIEKMRKSYTILMEIKGGIS
jgi:hypothetical protein